jgi:hypothetical protein
MAFNFDIRKIKFVITKKMRKPIQEVEDIGDWYGNYVIAYDTGDEIVNQAILIHEFVEMIIMKVFLGTWGIKEEKVDKIETKLERPFPHSFAHNLATKVEKAFIENLGRDWKNHQKFIDSLIPKYEKE